MILTQIAIWAPSITATLGVIASVIFALLKVKDALQEFRRTDDINALKSTINEQNTEIAKLNKRCELLLDNITKINGYVESKDD